MLSNPGIGPCKVDKSSRKVETTTLKDKLAIKSKSESEQKNVKRGSAWNHGLIGSCHRRKDKKTQIKEKRRRVIRGIISAGHGYVEIGKPPWYA